MNRPDDGAPSAREPSSPVTFSWPTVSPAATPSAPAASGRPSRRHTRRVVVVACAATLAVTLGGAALAIGSRDDAPAATTPSVTPTPSATPTVTTASPAELAALQRAVDTLTAELQAAAELWRSTEGLVADPATRDALQAIIDPAESWLDTFPEPAPEDAADARRLTLEAEAHLTALALRVTAVQESHAAHLAATAPTPGAQQPPPPATRPPRTGTANPAPQVPVAPPADGGAAPQQPVEPQQPAEPQQPVLPPPTQDPPPVTPAPDQPAPEPSADPPGDDGAENPGQ